MWLLSHPQPGQPATGTLSTAPRGWGYLSRTLPEFKSCSPDSSLLPWPEPGPSSPTPALSPVKGLRDSHFSLTPAHLANLFYAPPTRTPAWAQFLLALKGSGVRPTSPLRRAPVATPWAFLCTLKRVHTPAHSSHVGWDRDSLSPGQQQARCHGQQQPSIHSAEPTHREGHSAAFAHNWLLGRSRGELFVSAAQALSSTYAFLLHAPQDQADPSHVPLRPSQTQGAPAALAASGSKVNSAACLRGSSPGWEESPRAGPTLPLQCCIQQ